ncbi:MAG: 4-hydroxy-tetrahydrodipicolinate reductase [Myxococcota bacterium]
MTRIAVHGASGRMGREVLRLVLADPIVSLVAAFDRSESDQIGSDAAALCGEAPCGIEVLSLSDRETIEQRLAETDVVVDFSLPNALMTLCTWCEEQRVPLVTGTTGLSQAQDEQLSELAQAVPVVHAPNFSQGVGALLELAKQAIGLLDEKFDLEIVEMHHRRKVDAPSGTARKLAEVSADAKGWPHTTIRETRSGTIGPREDREIGVMTLRGGDVVGEHTLILSGAGERLELTHRATDRSIFARGAVRAAKWLVGRPARRYSMQDVIRAAGQEQTS